MSSNQLLTSSYFRLMLAVLLSAAGSFNVYSEIRPERLLLATQEWRPYQYIADGKMQGPGIEKLKCIMKVLKQPYQITMSDWDKAQISVEIGEQHAFFLASQNAVRDKYADYSSPVMKQVWSWYTLSDSMDTQSDIFKEKVAVTAIFGSNKWLWLHKAGYRVEKKPRRSTTLIELLLAGEVRAVLANDFVMEDAIKTLGVSHRAITRQILKEKPLGAYFSKKFTKQYPLFLSEFNQAITQCEER
ncbi:substrate-binding periplasmic protein [Psychromonas ossibalaenae]|uniref:substrate-binding periplasmic protein n=1 Tax=Psychromonas ossibalaenae TaxID=444922 RepID=UPI0003640997|nr:transporter substrate-binding domain-containing protein [Psychromonas ossibalaenae]